MESCGWNITRGWKRMKYRDLDNSYLNADVNIGSDADDEGWLFWHIVSFIVFFFAPTSLTFFCRFRSVLPT